MEHEQLGNEKRTFQRIIQKSEDKKIILRVILEKRRA